MEHPDLTTPSLAGIAASMRRIVLATLGALSAVALLCAAAYAMGRWA